MQKRTIIILVSVLLIISITICLIKGRAIERFDVDEASQNIASLYNSQEMTLTNLDVTQNLKAKDTNSNSLTVSGQSKLANMTADKASINQATINTINTNGINAKGATGSGNRAATHFPWKDGTNYISGPTLLRGGPLILNQGYQTLILNAPNWDRRKFVQQIENGGYMKGLEDGSVRDFIFIYPNRNTQPKVRVWYAKAVKLGKQFFLFHVTPDHHASNPFTATSDDGTWRGNI